MKKIINTGLLVIASAAGLQACTSCSTGPLCHDAPESASEQVEPNMDTFLTYGQLLKKERLWLKEIDDLIEVSRHKTSAKIAEEKNLHKALTMVDRQYYALDNNRFAYQGYERLAGYSFKAELMQAYMLFRGQGVVSNEARAKKIMVKLMPKLLAYAEAGDAYMQYRLSRLYTAGFSVDKDHVKSVYWMNRAAEQGQAYAMTNLGMAYQEGLGVDSDINKACELYERAYRLEESSSGGLGYMAWNIHVCHKKLLKNKDKEKSRYWLELASELGEPGAKRNLAKTFLSGPDAFKLQLHAKSLYLQNVQDSFDAASARALAFNLKDDRFGKKHYAELAAQLSGWQDADKLYRYAMQLISGNGAYMRDAKAAKHWFKVAADFGHEKASIEYKNLTEVKGF